MDEVRAARIAGNFCERSWELSCLDLHMLSGA